MPAIEVRQKDGLYHWEIRTGSALVQSAQGFPDSGQAARIGRTWLKHLVRAQEFYRQDVASRKVGDDKAGMVWVERGA
jgi:hypothetical protein